MSRMGVTYTVAAAAVAAGVAGIGTLMGGGEGAVWGAVAGFLVQVGVFWSFFVWSFKEQRGLAHGLGAMVRFFAVGMMALVGLTLTDLPPAPTLFSMVACLFGATLLEPLFLSRYDSAGKAGLARIRTQS